MIAKEMKRGLPFSKVGITRQMGKRIMHEAWKKVKTDPTFSRSDRKDLKVIVNAIKEKSRAAVLKKPDGSTKNIEAEKIEATKNPTNRLLNQATTKDINPKISSDSSPSFILTKNISITTPLDYKTTPIKLRHSEPAENNNSQTPTRQISQSEPTKNDDKKTSVNPFLNLLLSKTDTTNTSKQEPKISETPKIINNQPLPNQSSKVTSIKDMKNEILVKNLENSTSNNSVKTKPESIKTDDINISENNNKNIKSENEVVTNKLDKTTKYETIQKPDDNSENQTTNDSSDTKSKSTKDESSEPTKKTSAELAREEALRKKRNIASAGVLTRMLNEEAKKNNPDNKKTLSDPENSTGDKSAKPTTEPIISGSAKPRKTDNDQSTAEQFLDVDSIDYLTELAQKLNEQKQTSKPIISPKTVGIAEIAEKAEDMNI